MYTLLAICLVLHPMRIDESVHSHLREKYADKQLRMQKRSATVYFGLYCFFVWVFERAVLGKFKRLKSS